MPNGGPVKPSRGGRPARAKRHAQDHFDRWALSYDRSLLKEIVFFPAYRACRAEIVRWQSTRPRTSYRLLDVGCGTGTLLSVLAADPHAELLVGLDYSSEMVARAAAKLAGAPLSGKLHVVRSDSERLPFADAAFDALTCCNSFHHYPHQLAALAEFRRVLRPGGLLVLVDGFRDNVIGWFIFDLAVAAVERHVHHAAWSELRAMIAQAGFAHLRQRKAGVLAPLLINIAGA